MLALSTCTALIMGTAAWFHSETTIEFGGDSAQLNSGAEASPYGGGDGLTEQTAFIISNRRHLYNLAWLQYIGRYNNPNIRQLYFKVTAPIDMEGVTLPPIGTDTYPFLSHFDGNNQTISNLTISNDDPLSASSDFGVTKPSTSLLQGTVAPEIVGFFGVVGELPDQDITYSSNVVSVSNLTLNNLTVKSNSTKTLVGLAAGYIDGDMSGVKVDGNASFDLANSGKQKVDSRITDNISDYGLTGYSANTGFSGDYNQELSQYYISDDPNHGGVNWGGSLDVRKYNTWLYSRYLTHDSYGREVTSLRKGNSTSDFVTDPNEGSNNTNYHLQLRVENGTGNRLTTPNASNSNYYNYYSNPEDFDTPPSPLIASNKNHYIRYGISSSSYLPLIFKESDNLQWNTVSPANTGYIAGASTKTSPIFAASYNDMIQNSFSNTHTNRKVDSSSGHTNFDASNLETLELLTWSTADNNWVMIEDSYNQNHSTTNTTFYNTSTKQYRYAKKSATNPISSGGLGFEKYADSREQIFETFSHPRIHSLHFEGNELSASNVTNIPTATIGDETINNYKVPSGSIDFTLKESGFINFFAGTYASAAQSNMNFFSIYKVNRTGASVDSIQRITAVYNNTEWTATNNKPKYVYDLANANGSTTTSTGTKGTKLFDLAAALETSITNNASNIGLNNTLFYFEIPVNEGEYAMGAVHGMNSSNTAGASLIYLDIGTNGATAEANRITAYTVTTNGSGYKYPSGVDFAVTGVKGNSGIATGGVSFCVQIEPQASGDTMVFTVTESSVTISAVPTATNSSPSPLNSKYSYKGTGFSTAATTPTGKFKVINGPSSTIDMIDTKTMVSHISLPSTSGRVEITVTDVFEGASITSTTYKLGDDSYSSSDVSGVPVIPSALSSTIPLLKPAVVTLVRSLDNAITLTMDRNGTVASFDSVLPVMPWPNPDTYVVRIDPYPSGLIINATRTNTAYSLSINGTPVVFDNNNSGTYSA